MKVEVAHFGVADVRLKVLGPTNEIQKEIGIPQNCPGSPGTHENVIGRAARAPSIGDERTDLRGFESVQMVKLEGVEVDDFLWLAVTVHV